MRVRPFLAAAAAAVLAATVPAHAATPTLDGKKTKTLTFKDVTTTPQDNDKDFASLSSGDRTQCAQPRCAKFTFLYKPAKGVKNARMSVRISWTYPVEDYDLYVNQDNAGTVGNCGAFAGTSELVIIDQPAPGHKYTIVIDHYRSIPDTVTATVQYASKVQEPTTVPGAVDSKQGENCG